MSCSGQCTSQSERGFVNPSWQSELGQRGRFRDTFGYLLLDRGPDVVAKLLGQTGHKQIHPLLAFLKRTRALMEN